MAGTGKRERGNVGMVWDTAGRLLRYCPQILRLNIIHLMYGPEGNSQFCFPESPDVPRDEVGKHRDSGENKTNYFPEGPYIKCFVIYLDFHIAKTKKQRRRAGNNCAIVSLSGYIC